MLKLGLKLGLSAALAGAPLSAYAANGFEPAIVWDYPNNYFRKNNVRVAHDDLLTFTRASEATVFDSDGLLKWVASNIFLNSATGVTQNVTTKAVQYTLGLKGTGTITLTGTSTAGPLVGTGANDLVTLDFTPTAGTLTMTVTGDCTVVRIYRSDLGGVQANPDTNSDPTYVATGGSAVYKRGLKHEYDGADWIATGVPMEPAATNDIINSNNIEGSNWLTAIPGILAYTADQGTGPDGNLSLYKVAINATTNAEHLLYSDAHTVVSGDDYCVSAVVKDVSQQFVMFRLFNGQHALTAVTYDLTTKTVTQENDGTNAGFVVDSGVIDLGGGLLRIWTTINIARTVIQVAFQTSNTGTPGINSYGAFAYSGTVGDHFLLGHIQFEKGTFPTAIIPTDGTTEARDASVVTIPSANLSSVVNTTAMSMKLKGIVNYVDEGAASQLVLSKWQVDANNYIITDMDTDSVAIGEINFNQNVATVLDTVSSAAGAYLPSFGTAISIASRHTSGAINGATDGISVTENATPAALVDLSTADIELFETAQGTISAGAIWAEDIGDVGIEEASEPYSPHEIFSGGADGIYGKYANLFEEHTGKTLAEDDGDPVGLLIEAHAFGGQSLTWYLAGQPEQLTNNDFSGGTTTHGSPSITVPTGWESYNSANVSASDVVGGNFVFTATDHLGGIKSISLPLAMEAITVRARRISGSSIAVLNVYSGAWLQIVAPAATEDQWYEVTFRVTRSVSDFIISHFNANTAEWEIEFASSKAIISNALSQSDSGKKPDLSITAGVKKLQFDGLTQTLHGGKDLNFGQGSWWCCAMINPSTVSATQVIFGKGDNSSVDNIRMIINSSSKSYVHNGSGAYPASTGAVSVGDNQILEWGVDADTNEVFYAIDGVEERISITLSGTGSNALDWFIGQDTSGGFSEAFDLGDEFVLVDEMPSAANRLKMRQYLANLHGVTLS